MFVPSGSEFLQVRAMLWSRISVVWFRVLAEDYWVESKFGKLEQTQGSDQGRTVFCHFFPWPARLGGTPEHEEASARDPQARESWNRAMARVMPPATAWVQERWDIRDIPCYFPPEPEFDPEEDPGYAREQKRLLEEYLRFHGFEPGEQSR